MIANQEKESLILEMINTAGEAWRQVPALLSNGMEALWKLCYGKLYHMLLSIGGIADESKKEESELNLPEAIASIKFTLPLLLLTKKQLNEGRRR